MEALRQLRSGLRTYYDAFLEPVRDRIGAAVSADVAWRSRSLVTGGTRALLDTFGTRALLDTFRPMAVWQPPVREVDYPVERELHLEGRGLLLVPSYFCWRRPIALVDESIRPVLVYPADKTVVPAPDTGTPSAGTSHRHTVRGRDSGPSRVRVSYPPPGHGAHEIGYSWRLRADVFSSPRRPQVPPGPW